MPISPEQARINGKKGGRKKGFAALEAEKAREMIAIQLSEHLLPILKKAIKQAKIGDRYAREWLTDRAFGKASQGIVFKGTLDIAKLLNDAEKE